MAFEIFCMVIIAIMFGLALAFGGYRLFLVILPIWGFFAGFGIGAQTVTVLLPNNTFLGTVTGWVVGFLVGLLFAVLSYLFYLVGVAIFSGTVGYALVVSFLTWIGLNPGFLSWLIAIVGGVALAFVVLRFDIQKVVIIILTAAMGAGFAIAGLVFPFGGFTLADFASGYPISSMISDSWLWLLLWAIVVAMGIVFQWRANRDFVLTAPADRW